MAITKIHPIKTNLKKSIDYICNGEKTLEEILNNYHNKDSNTFSIKLLTSYSYEQKKGINKIPQT